MNFRSKDKNYKVLIAVFFLAVIFWFVVKLSKRYDYTLDIPLKVVINNPDICLKYPTPEKVRVQFLGIGTELLRLSFYDPIYQVDLSDVESTIELNFTEHWEYVVVPDELSVSVKSIVTPHEVKFELDKRTVKPVAVKVRAEIATEPGFIFVGTRSRPDSVEISGPASYVDTLRFITTEKKTYKSIKSAFSDHFELQKNPLFYAECQPGKVEALINIQRLAEKEIKEVPVSVINVPDNYEVVPLPSQVTVYVKGGEKILAEAGVEDFSVKIDFVKDWQPGATRVQGTVNTDLNTLYVESRPQYFELIVQKKRR